MRRGVGARSAVLVVTMLVGLLALVAPAAQADGLNAVITNAGCQANSIAANDDGSTGSVTLPFTINFFGSEYSSLYVNNNGNVTFDGPLSTYTPFSLQSTNHVIIAPFFADVDTRGAGSGIVQYGDIAAGATEVGGHPAFCVNWVNVGYYSAHTDKTNSFQLLLVDRSDTGPGNFDIIFNYDRIQWETGDASGGVDGLGGSSARVGYSNGSTASYELAGSAVPGSFLDSNTDTGLIHNNVNSPLQQGRYIFPVRNGAATGHSISGHIWANSAGNPVNNAFISACPTPADTPCRLTSSQADGSYTLPNLPDHTSGGGSVDHTWNLTVNPPSGSELSSGTAGPITVDGSDVPDQNVTLQGPTPLPSGASVTTDSRGTQTSGTPTVYWQDAITLHVDGCAGGSGTATLQAGSWTENAPLDETSPGSGHYTATLAAPYPHHGTASISWTISCGTTGEFTIYIDPSGTVQTVGGDPISGATVTLYRSDDPSGPFVQVPDGSALMSSGNRNNPDTTDSTGHFGWDVLAGYYKVRAEKSGCTSPDGSSTYVESDVLTIPPPVTDLVLQLACGASTDTTAPATTTSLDPSSPNGAHDWYKTSVGVSISATDPDDTVAQTRCVLDPARPPASFDDLPASDCSLTSVSSDGSHTIYAASIDSNGNKEAVQSVDFKIDQTPPSLAPTLSEATIYLNQTGGRVRRGRVLVRRTEPLLRLHRLTYPAAACQVPPGVTVASRGVPARLCRIWCAWTPGLTSVRDPDLWWADDRMFDWVIPLGEALRPLNLSALRA